MSEKLPKTGPGTPGVAQSRARNDVVAEIERIMASGQWVRGLTGRAMAAELGLEYSTVRHYAAEAYRSLLRRSDSEDIERIRRETIHELREMAADSYSRIDHVKLGASYMKAAVDATVRAAEVAGVPVRAAGVSPQKIVQEREAFLEKIIPVMCEQCRDAVLAALTADQDHPETSLDG